jgi:hypothetical protein
VRDRIWTPFLPDGAALHGEWLAQAHGTIYRVDKPFVVFDLTIDGKRRPYDEMLACVAPMGLPVANLLHRGPPIPISQAMEIMGDLGHHGATEQPEGVVYRVERRGSFDFMAKYVRPDKIDGKYLPDISGKETVWMWRHPSIMQSRLTTLEAREKRVRELATRYRDRIDTFGEWGDAKADIGADILAILDGDAK